MPVKRIICLANSRKPDGRCLAGIEIIDGKAAGWIRPVSAREGGSVSERERQYQDGKDPSVLDIIDVPLLRAKTGKYQRENWVLDDRYYWVKKKVIPASKLKGLGIKSGPLWVDGHHTALGENDRIPLEVANKLDSSLTLIHVKRLSLLVHDPGRRFGGVPKRRVQGLFKLGEVDYNLRITDPLIEREYFQQKDGTYELGECLLTVSLGEPYNAYVYKLIAAVITL